MSAESSCWESEVSDLLSNEVELFLRSLQSGLALAASSVGRGKLSLGDGELGSKLGDMAGLIVDRLAHGGEI